MKNVFLLLLLINYLQGQAQYTITFQFKKLPTYQAANSPVFMAGTFNNWKPDSTTFSTATSALSIRLPKGTYEYKFTHGSWQSGETNLSGAALNNRTLTVESDTTISIEIMGWADHFAQSQRRSTAGKNVHILDTAFYMPQLNRYRRIWIYLPESYAA